MPEKNETPPPVTPGTEVMRPPAPRPAEADLPEPADEAEIHADDQMLIDAAFGVASEVRFLKSGVKVIYDDKTYQMFSDAEYRDHLVRRVGPQED